MTNDETTPKDNSFAPSIPEMSAFLQTETGSVDGAIDTVLDEAESLLTEVQSLDGVSAGVKDFDDHVNLPEVARIIASIKKYCSLKIVGQDNLQEALLVSLIANGHILLESLPGLAKTTAARTLAESVEADFKRIQCTPDLLPSDIIGTQIYNQGTQQFSTQLGPVHSNFLLLDEINRSSAKTQSAMLEAMEEKQTTIGGETYSLPNPFMVIATQNPIEQEGTYELPEAQLDRFLMKVVISYPHEEEELSVLKMYQHGAFDQHQQAAITLSDVRTLQEEVKKVEVHDSIMRYIVNIVNATRSTDASGDYHKYVKAGASPRASIAFMKAAQALALSQNRTSVTPDDIAHLRYSILRHRILTTYEADLDNVTVEMIIDNVFSQTPTP